MTRDRINLSEKGESVKTELETAEVLNKFFFDIVNNLEISKYSKYESFIDNIEDQTLRAILKYKNHPSIIAIQNKFKGGDVRHPTAIFFNNTRILSQLFFVLSQPKLYAHFKILFSLMFFKEEIVIFYFMYCFWRNTPTYLPTYFMKKPNNTGQKLPKYNKKLRNTGQKSRKYHLCVKNENIQNINAS